MLVYNDSKYIYVFCEMEMEMEMEMEVGRGGDIWPRIHADWADGDGL